MNPPERESKYFYHEDVFPIGRTFVYIIVFNDRNVTVRH